MPIGLPIKVEIAHESLTRRIAEQKEPKQDTEKPSNWEKLATIDYLVTIRICRNPKLLAVFI